METLFHDVASNAVLATVAALIVWAGARFIRRPELTYWLWALVLLKLVTPPLIDLPFSWPVPPGPTTAGQPAMVTSEIPSAVGQHPEPPLAILPAPFPQQRAEEPSRLRGTEQPDQARPGTNSTLAAWADGFRQVWASISWGVLAVSLWLLGSVLWLALAGFRLARFQRLLRQDEPATEPLQLAARQLAKRYALKRSPEIRVLKRQIPPLLWWAGHRAVIVLPASLLEQLDHDGQAALIAHELAHYRRGDHLVRWAEVAVLALYWWHPVAWWACRRLHQAEEQCCDAWVVRVLPGRQKGYAHTLLSTVEFLAEPSLSLPLPASGMGDIGTLRRRLEMILNGHLERRISWLYYPTLIAAAMALLPWSATGSPQEPTKPDTRATVKGDAPMTHATTDADRNRTLTGTVVGPDGSPVAGAQLWLVEYPEDRHPILSHQLVAVALPTRQWNPTPRVLAQARTDTAGRFGIRWGEAAPGESAPRIVAKADGLGLACQIVQRAGAEQKVQLPRSVPIQGHLLASNGQPAVDVEVTAEFFFAGHCGAGVRDVSEKNWPEYWPRPVHTDKDGKFTLTGMPATSHVSLRLLDPGHVLEQVIVDTGLGETDRSRALQLTPLPPTFSRKLPPTRIVEGTVTASDTGQPLSRIMVSVTAMGTHGGVGRFGQTDEQGRYRVTSEAQDSYFLTAYPRPDSGYIAANAHREHWPQGSERMVQDFSLDRGRLVRGQVVEEPGGKPIPGASVTYRLSKDNPLFHKRYELRNPTLSDEQGRFALTVLTGAGCFLVETPERTYVRKPLADLPTHYKPTLALGYTPVTVPQEGAVNDVLIKLHRGRTVTLQAVGPDGERLPSVTALWEGLSVVHDQVWNTSYDFPQAAVVIPELGPDQSRRVVLVNTDRKLGGIFDITPQTAAGPIEVRLKPLGTIVGQMVSESGEPATNAQANLYMSLDSAATHFNREELWYRNVFYANFIHQSALPDSWPGGKFVLENIVPGIPLGLQGVASDISDPITIPPLQPGQRLDVGKIVLTQPPKPPRPATGTPAP